MNRQGAKLAEVGASQFFWLLLGVLGVLAVASCSAGAPGPGIDVDRALAHVAQLTALGPHPGDSPQAKEAARYIEAQLEVIGVPVERLDVGGVDLDAIEVLGTTWRRAHHVDTTDPDLLVRFGPPGPALLIMAHYDTVPPSPGAVDNSAAVGVLIELARVLHEQPPAQPVMLAFTANEEIGLVGAEALAAQRGSERSGFAGPRSAAEGRRGEPIDVAFAVALDLIGASGPLTLNGASTLIGRAEMHWIADAAEHAGVAISAPLPHRVISRWWPQAERSDHGVFTRHGIRAIHFYDRGQDGERIDLAYHSARDVASRVDRASIDEIGRMLRALVATPPPAHDGDSFWIPATNLIVPRWLLVAFEIACLLACIPALIPRRREHERGWGVLAGIACYAVAVGIAIAIEKLAAGAHPAPWLHAPLRWELAESAIILGALGLLVRLAARWRPWIGERRYRALAVVPLVVVGIALLAIDAPELAWVWLAPAAIIALAPAPIAVLASLVTPALALAPDQLREAFFNGFLPAQLPLAAWLATAPTAATLAWALRRRPVTGPLGSLVLALGCGLAVVSGATVVLLAHPACSATEFNQFRLACEQVRTWP